MILLQIFGIGIALVALYIFHYYLKRKDFNKLEFAIWLIIWLGFIIVIIAPSSFNFLLETFSIYRIMDLIMIVAFIVIYILVFYNYVVNKRIQQKIELLIRKDALKNIKK